MLRHVLDRLRGRSAQQGVPKEAAMTDEEVRPPCTCCNRRSMGPLWGKPGNPLICAVCDGGKALAEVKMGRKL